MNRRVPPEALTTLSIASGVIFYGTAVLGVALLAFLWGRVR